MFRLIAALASLLFLGGCWFSDGELFEPSEFARVEVAETYTYQGFGSDEVEIRASLTEEGRVRFDNPEEPDDPMIIALVPIEGAADGYFIAMVEDKEDRPLYFMARSNLPSGLEIIYPNCQGTPEIAGLVRENNSCRFTDKGALLASAKIAAEFLDSEQIVMQLPAMVFMRGPPGPRSPETAE